MRLQDKVAIVTGGARGIGRAIAEGYAREGATVAVCDVLTAAAEATAEEMGGKAFAVAVDVTDQESIDAMVAKVMEKCGRIDLLVNNAAVFDLAPLEDITQRSYDRVFDVNVKGLLFVTQAVVAKMREGGHGGKIVNMASQAGRRGEPLVAVYCASKAAVISLTQSLGLNLIKDKIYVNGIAPGVHDTDMWEEVDALFARYEGLEIKEKFRQVEAALPIGRFGTAEDLVGAAIFLASSESDYVVGQTIDVNGGNWVSG